jgi:hypothetical protein
MWRWESELREAGFRRKGERYWQCERRFGLPTWAHISLFCWSEQITTGERLLVELDAFHVTFVLGGEHLHFYYHEQQDNEWEPAGHTSVTEISRLCLDAHTLRAEADAIAEALVAALAGILHPRCPEVLQTGEEPRDEPADLR